MKPADPHYRPDIEGLRALAVTSVVLYHANISGFSGGFVGVDIFFVLSGFLITGLLVRELDRTGRVDLAQFWARRARRLLPVAALVLVVVAVVGTWTIPPMDRRDAGLGIVTAAVYAANWFFARRRLDYLSSDDAPSPVLHYWSLGVEEQFYLLWPLVVVALAMSGRHSVGRVRTRLLAGVGVLSAASFIASIAMTSAEWQPVAFFGSPTRVWQLGAGAILSIAMMRDAQPSRTTANVLGVLGISGISLSVALMHDAASLGLGYPGYLAMVPTVSVVAVVVAGYRSWCFSSWLGSPPMTWLGRLSYGWYLWHWPALLLAREQASTAERLLLLGAALVVAWVTYHVVENPVRFSPFLQGRPARSVALAVMLTLVSISAGLWLRYNDLVRVEALALAGGPPPFDPMPSGARDDLPILYSNGCHLNDGLIEAGPCEFGDLKSETTVVLFGDSHATALFPGLELAAEELGWRLMARVKSNCYPADVVQFDGSTQLTRRECSSWRDHVISELETVRPHVIVVSGFERRHPGSDGGGGDTGDRIAFTSLLGADGRRVEDVVTATEVWQQGMRRTLSRLVATGAQVVYVRDNPRVPRAALECLSWNPLEPDRCSFPRDLSSYADLYVAAAGSVPGVRVADYTSQVCDANRCHLVSGKTLIFRDSDHYTASFSRTISQLVRDAIAPVP